MSANHRLAAKETKRANALGRFHKPILLRTHITCCSYAPRSVSQTRSGGAQWAHPMTAAPLCAQHKLAATRAREWGIAHVAGKQEAVPARRHACSHYWQLPTAHPFFGPPCSCSAVDGPCASASGCCTATNLCQRDLATSARGTCKTVRVRLAGQHDAHSFCCSLPPNLNPSAELAVRGCGEAWVRHSLKLLHR